MYELHSAFEEDALESSHPLNAVPEDVTTTSEIIGMFDAISYSKVECQNSGYTTCLQTTRMMRHTETHTTRLL